MSRTFKLILALLIVASVSSAVLAVIAFIGKEREYVKRLILEDKLATSLKEKRALEKELSVAKTAKGEIEAKFKETEEKIQKLSGQLDEEKQTLELAAGELETKKKELAKFKADLENEKKEKLAISKNLETLQSDYDKVTKEVARLRNEKSSLEKKVAELEEKAVNLDKIVVGSREKGSLLVPVEPVKPLLEGKVLVVNKEYSFVVTDLGQDKGVQKGMLFDIKNGNELLAKAEIDKVYDTMSSATVLPGGKINDIKKGHVIIESR